MRFHNIVLAVFSAIYCQGNVASAIPLLDPPQYNGQSIKGRNKLQIREDAITSISLSGSPNSPLEKRNDGLSLILYGEEQPSSAHLSGGALAGIVIGILAAIILCVMYIAGREILEWLQKTSVSKLPRSRVFWLGY